MHLGSPFPNFETYLPDLMDCSYLPQSANAMGDKRHGKRGRKPRQQTLKKAAGQAGVRRDILSGRLTAHAALDAASMPPPLSERKAAEVKELVASVPSPRTMAFIKS
jgi:hypothetical protein